MTLSKVEKQKALYFQGEKKISSYFDVFLSVNNIPKRFVSSSVIDTFIQNYIETDIDDFISNSPALDEDNLDVVVYEYIEESYDYDSFVVEFERILDFDKIRSSMVDELTLLLINTEPYGHVSRSYWYRKVRTVPTITLLGKFIEGHLEDFVISYAEDWMQYKQEI